MKGKAGMATEGTGKNAARDLGQGWKISPSVRIPAKSTFTMGEIDGSGAIQQMWMTPALLDRTQIHILRLYWDGEIKFYMDGDKEFPTICGTGTEDYFCASYDFENREVKKYQTFSTPYTGLAQVLPPDKIYEVGQRFGLYRWHVTDLVRFEKDLRVTIQALGWQKDGKYLQEEDDIASVAYWYQAEPHAAFPKLPDREALKVAPQK